MDCPEMKQKMKNDETSDKPLSDANEIRDELPADLNVSAFVGPYKFPDNSRRRIPGALYLLISVLWLVVVGSKRKRIGSCKRWLSRSSNFAGFSRLVFIVSIVANDGR